MTDDAALASFLEAAKTARTKVVMVGDPRQLSSVGPGGGFEALVQRFGAAVHVLSENVRQIDVTERRALERLRSGNVYKAVAWYVGAGRIQTALSRIGAVDQVVEGWMTDVLAGKNAAMYAWRRANVADLNRSAREVWQDLGRLSGPELAVGEVGYRTGDRVVSLAPGAGGQVVTSETGTVVAVDVKRQQLAAQMDDDKRIQQFGPDDLGATRLTYGYAVTVHRSQGATVDRAHVLEDGGGRELAYVKMSRAKDRTTVYAVADSVDQAAEDLRRSWAQERRIGWAIDQGEPVPGRKEAERARAVSATLRHARLVAEREALAAAIPPDVALERGMAGGDVQRLERKLKELNDANGWDLWRGTPVGEAAVAWQRAESEQRRCLAEAKGAGLRWGHQLRKDAERAAERAEPLRERFEQLAGRERERIEAELPRARRWVAQLDGQDRARGRFEREHPEALRRLDRLDEKIKRAAYELDLERQAIDGIAPRQPHRPKRSRGLERGRDMDMGLDLGL